MKGRLATNFSDIIMPEKTHPHLEKKKMLSKVLVSNHKTQAFQCTSKKTAINPNINCNPSFSRHFIKQPLCIKKIYLA
jgi:hypothetical protein